MIDVIIPIYKGYQETRECITSVMNCECSQQFRVIAINDCSPDVEIKKYLLSIDHDERFILLENEENMGFVKTVNRGMAYSDNDVILLNSDTVVTRKWVDKLFNAAYSSSNVGTVTPLTNKGTIASVPIFNRDNEIPEGFSIDTFSALVEKISNRSYPVIPTAVGHAMYVKREVTNLIGLLDEKTFGKGYYEEVDFSLRVSKAGFKNILADDTFIYHYGSTSFQHEKVKLIRRNKLRLLRKHVYFPVVFKFFFLFDYKVKAISKRIQAEIF